MRRFALWALVALLPTACCPLKLITANRLAIDEPVIGHVKLESDTPWKGDFKLESESPFPTRTQAPVVAMPLTAGAPSEGCAKVALIDVDGILLNQNMTGLSSVGDNPVAVFKEKLDAAAVEPGVVAVVLRLNTPGGAVNASDIMFQELQRFRARTRLPVVACVLDMAAGGGYYLAAGCDFIMAAPTSVVGGVGVVWNSFALRGAMNVLSIGVTPIKSGDLIDMGSTLYPPLEDDDKVKGLLKSMCEDYHAHFKARLRQVRPRLPEHCDFPNEPRADLLDGRVMAGPKALSCGLIDRLGYLDDAIAIAREMAKQPAAQVVLFHRSNDPAFSQYAITPNTPLQGTAFPLSIPGADRSKLPTFLFMWLAEPTAERLSGR